jgi:hypothetical protein
MNKKITYKEAIDMLNGLCEGLGDAFDYNTKTDPMPISPYSISGLKPITSWISTCFMFSCTPEGGINWYGITRIIVEMDMGRGCPKDKAPKPSENYAYDDSAIT